MSVKEIVIRLLGVENKIKINWLEAKRIIPNLLIVPLNY